MSWVQRHLHWLGAGLAFVVTQVVYLKTMTITCPFWDSGEFIATSYILGIPHPPGTPLYELIGRVFAMLAPFPLVATRVNWLSALSSSLTAAFTYLVTVEFWRRARSAGASSFFSPTPSSVSPASSAAVSGHETGVFESEENGSSWVAFFAGLVAAFFCAFSRTFWDNSIEAEVYSLSSLIMALSVWLILRWGRSGGSRFGRNGLFILLYYLLCLSMGIHLGTFLVLPGIVLFALLVDHHSFARGKLAALVVAGVVVLLHPGMLPTLGLKIWLPVVAGVLLAALMMGRKWPVVGGRGLLFWCLVVAVVGLSTHFYLTIRALYHNPSINEADPQTWDALWKVLTRDQYKPPNPFEVRQASWSVQLGRHFWDYARDQYSLGLRPAWVGWYIPYLLGLAGLVWQWKREKKGFALLGVNYLIMTLGLVFYLNFKEDEVRPRDYFFVAAFQFYAVWIGLGTGAVLQWAGQGLGERRLEEAGGAKPGSAGGSRWVWGAGAVLTLLPFLTCAHYWFEHDRTNFYIARDFAYNMLAPLKPNAIIFTNGDNDTFPLWYLQEVEKIRQDVRVANLSLLNTDWYIRQLRDQPPKIDLGWSDADISQLEPYMDSKTKEPVWVKDIAVNRIISREYGKRPIYVASTVPEMLGSEDRLVMQGVAFELGEKVPGSGERIDVDLTLHNLREVYKYRGLLRPDGKHDTSVYKDENAQHLVHNYAVAYMRAAEAKMDQGDEDTARAALQTAAQISPDFRPAQYALGMLLMQAHKYAEAEEYFQSLERRGWGDQMLYRRLGRTQEAQGKMDQAEQSYRQALSTDPGDFDSMRDLFSFLWQVRGKKVEAYGILQAWSERHPDDKRVAGALREFRDSLGGETPPPQPEGGASR
jgi:tetratricopeptide (TPR) repeat protein